MPRSFDAIYRDGALAVRQEYSLGHGRVDPVEALRRRGVEVVSRPIGNGGSLDGYFEQQDGQATVFINSSMPILRQRFTAAHELGHAVFDMDAGASIIDADVDHPPKSDRMNSFAGAFLVDPAGVLELREEGHEGLGLIAAAVQRFEVSVQAAAVELRKLDAVTTPDADDARNYPGTDRFMRKMGIRFKCAPLSLGAVDPERQRRVRAAFKARVIDLQTATRMLGLTPEDAETWLESQGATPDALTDPAAL